MNRSTTDASLNAEDYALGAKVISYAAQTLAFVASMALASACEAAGQAGDTPGGGARQGYGCAA